MARSSKQFLCEHPTSDIHVGRNCATTPQLGFWCVELGLPPEIEQVQLWNSCFRDKKCVSDLKCSPILTLFVRKTSGSSWNSYCRFFDDFNWPNLPTSRRAHHRQELLFGLGRCRLVKRLENNPTLWLFCALPWQFCVICGEYLKESKQCYRSFSNNPKNRHPLSMLDAGIFYCSLHDFHELPLPRSYNYFHWQNDRNMFQERQTRHYLSTNEHGELEAKFKWRLNNPSTKYVGQLGPNRAPHFLYEKEDEYAWNHQSFHRTVGQNSCGDRLLFQSTPRAGLSRRNGIHCGVGQSFKCIRSPSVLVVWPPVSGASLCPTVAVFFGCFQALEIEFKWFSNDPNETNPGGAQTVKCRWQSLESSLCRK